MSYCDSSCRHRNGDAGEPPAGASLPSSLREDPRRSPAAASPPLRACGGGAARLAHPAPRSGDAGESARTDPALRQKTRSALWMPTGGGFPRLSLLSGSPNVTSHAAVSSFQTVRCIMHIEMRGGHFAVMNQANQRLRSLDV